MRRLFITGTDTEIGKTHVACALIRHLVKQGHDVAAMKPVASDCQTSTDGLRNEDALLLIDAMNVDLDYQTVNPFAYEAAIAPHIAAQHTGKQIDLDQIAANANNICADFLVIEGVGGWKVPLGEELMLADMVTGLQAEVILVVGMRLGCINHALLSASQIIGEGFKLTGWIANQIDPVMHAHSENLNTLKKLLPAPMLGKVPHVSKNVGNTPEFLAF